MCRTRYRTSWALVPIDRQSGGSFHASMIVQVLSQRSTIGGSLNSRIVLRFVSLRTQQMVGFRPATPTGDGTREGLSSAPQRRPRRMMVLTVPSSGEQPVVSDRHGRLVRIYR